jgi:Protein of unknown function (DUF1579)
MTHDELFRQLAGTWQGDSQTWFEPDKLADQSQVRSQFSLVFNGRFLRHIYEGSMQGKPRKGEELIAFNAITGLYQVTWIDDFHMNYAILFSQGPARENGWDVLGQYDVGADQAPWGWRTRYELLDPDHLTVTAFNIVPGGPEAKAVECVYERSKV